MQTKYGGAFGAWLLVCALCLASSVSFAKSDARSERVSFKKGSSGAVINSAIKGYQTVDYLLGAREGQRMSVSLSTKHTATYFNILAPGENESALFVGSTSGNRFDGTLSASGDYKIRVYMMRSAARRNETAKFRLEVSVVGASAAAAKSESVDAKVAGTGFNATGQVPCSMGNGQPTSSCAFGVVRQGSGNAMVTVTKPDGSKRVIFFEKGSAIGYDKSQADAAEFKVKKQSDLNVITIGEERYEIPDAAAFGG
jgi:hypothetical protein